MITLILKLRSLRLYKGEAPGPLFLIYSVTLSEVSESFSPGAPGAEVRDHRLVRRIHEQLL